jgi:UDP-N-acetylglucosamine--N-acetylmuramyl-(pentapeptide) pyrophosphoryl-undecaprenol N-acetylglucosamine transferase
MTAALEIDRESRPVLVASTGGHLEQLHHWASRWGVLGGESTWITFRNEQSESLLESENVVYVPYVAPRDIGATWAARKVIQDAVREQSSRLIVSTGAAVAVSAAMAASATRTRMIYIESLARVDKLSLTGRILKRWPGIERYTQSPLLVSREFRYGGSVMDNYGVSQRSDWTPKERLRVLVTVGTIRPYGFNRLLEQLDPIVRGDDVIWQTGESTFAPSHGEVRPSMSRSALIDEVRKADVVISHAGVGSILSCLANGKVPIVVTRRKEFNEHIDDHQQNIADLLGERGLVTYAEPEDLTRELIREATKAYSFRADAASI